MTIDEFNKTSFGPGMKIKYDGEIIDVICADFVESLFGFNIDAGSLSKITWARCENVELIKCNKQRG